MTNDKQRERLVELLSEDIDMNLAYYVADNLLANGGLFPPCKVGQTVYVISNYYTGKKEIYECIVDSITMYYNNTFLSMTSQGKFTFGENVSQLGVTVFLTKEEAEKALGGVQ